jgi:mannosyltransferase
MADMSRRRCQDPLEWWLVLGVALALHAWRLDAKNLWLDECASWDMATQSVTRLIAATAADIHPPLYYLLLKGWMWWLGDSPIGLRSLSVLASLVSLWLMCRLAEGVLPRGATFAALLWYAALPNVVSFSQEARMYALATASVLAMCLAYRRWVDSGFRSRPALVAYAGCATAALYLHYFTALAVAAIWAHTVLVPERRRPSLPVEGLAASSCGHKRAVHALGRHGGRADHARSAVAAANRDWADSGPGC